MLRVLVLGSKDFDERSNAVSRIFYGLAASVIAGSADLADESIKTDAAPATVQVVGNGVFSLPQGQSVYIEQAGSKILLAFPLKKETPSRNAYWPGSLGKYPHCRDLAEGEFEIRIGREAVCVRMGFQIDTMRSIGDGALAKDYNGGCDLDIVRFDSGPKTVKLIARADCMELTPFAK
jgi:hypothetical protein